MKPTIEAFKTGPKRHGPFRRLPKKGSVGKLVRSEAAEMSAHIFFDMEVGEAFEYREKT